MKRVVWITGLSGAGKSTLAQALGARLRSGGQPVVVLDGDELREVLGVVDPLAANHGREGRLALAFRYAQLCRMIASQDVTVVIATISLFHEVHAWNREHLPGYFEVYLQVPLDELRRRDPKGIYRRFDEGSLQNVAGLDLPVDEPTSADCRFDFDPSRSVADLVDQLTPLLLART